MAYVITAGVYYFYKYYGGNTGDYLVLKQEEV